MDGMTYERPVRAYPRRSHAGLMLALLPLAFALLLQLTLAVFCDVPPAGAEPVTDTSFMWGP